MYIHIGSDGDSIHMGNNTDRIHHSPADRFTFIWAMTTVSILALQTDLHVAGHINGSYRPTNRFIWLVTMIAFITALQTNSFTLVATMTVLTALQTDLHPCAMTLITFITALQTDLHSSTHSRSFKV